MCHLCVVCVRVWEGGGVPHAVRRTVGLTVSIGHSCKHASQLNSDSYVVASSSTTLSNGSQQHSIKRHQTQCLWSLTETDGAACAVEK